MDRADRFCPKCEKSRARVAEMERRNISVHREALMEVTQLRDKLTKRLEMDVLDQAIEEQFSDGNEFFEPIMHLDEDLREILIDILNEKIRCILSLDMSKIAGGRIFGLKLDSADNKKLESKIAQLEDELENMKCKVGNIEDSKDGVESELLKYKHQLEMYQQKFEKQQAASLEAQDRYVVT